MRCATPQRIAVDLTPQAVEQVAGRVAQLLTHQQQQQAQQTERLIGAGELALHLGVTRAWIYKHRHLLGGHRIGDGPKAQWRFDRLAAIAALDSITPTDADRHTSPHNDTTTKPCRRP